MRTGMVMLGIGTLILYATGCSKKPAEEVKAVETIESKVNQESRLVLENDIAFIQGSSFIPKDYFVGDIKKYVKQLEKEEVPFTAYKEALEHLPILRKQGHTENLPLLIQYFMDNYDKAMENSKTVMLNTLATNHYDCFVGIPHTIENINRKLIEEKIPIPQEKIHETTKKLLEFYSQLKNKT